jgi:hypothetical protein
MDFFGRLTFALVIRARKGRDEQQAASFSHSQFAQGQIPVTDPFINSFLFNSFSKMVSQRFTAHDLSHFADHHSN